MSLGADVDRWLDGTYPDDEDWEPDWNPWAPWRVDGETLLRWLLEGRDRDEVECVARLWLICEPGSVTVYSARSAQELEAGYVTSHFWHRLVEWVPSSGGGKRVRNMTPHYVDDDDPDFRPHDPHAGKKLYTKTSLDSETWVIEHFLRADDSPHGWHISRGSSDLPAGRPKQGVREAEVIELAVAHALGDEFTLEELLATVRRGRPRESERPARAALVELVAALTSGRHPIHVGTLAERWRANQATLYRLRREGELIMRKNLPNRGGKVRVVEDARADEQPPRERLWWTDGLPLVGPKASPAPRRPGDPVAIGVLSPSQADFGRPLYVPATLLPQVVEVDFGTEAAHEQAA